MRHTAALIAQACAATLFLGVVGIYYAAHVATGTLPPLYQRRP